MKTELELAKEKLEEAIALVQEVNEKRIRIEGQYEASLEALKRLGYSGIPEATKDYKAAMATLESDVATLLADVQSFLEEFEAAFAGVSNG